MPFQPGNQITARPLAERFWEKVRKTEGCWEWAGAKIKGGYGHVCVGQKRRLAHRVAWELSMGVIPQGMEICHRCDNPSCVRVDHLFQGTHLENMRDRDHKGRTNNAPAQAALARNPALRVSRGDRNGARRHPETLARGVENFQAKLDDDKVRLIRASRDTTAALARRFGVSEPALKAARTGRTWRHVF